MSRASENLAAWRKLGTELAKALNSEETSELDRRLIESTLLTWSQIFAERIIKRQANEGRVAEVTKAWMLDVVGELLLSSLSEQERGQVTTAKTLAMEVMAARKEPS